MRQLIKLTNWVWVVLLLTAVVAPGPPARAALPDRVRGQAAAIHVVAWGDNLYRIARHYGVSVEAICAANGIVNPSAIYAGQTLRIPIRSAAGIVSRCPA
jgi:nucleoid-associated protein YgaU